MINPVTGVPFSEADADRLLGLADSFMEDWEANEGKFDKEECAERRKEFDAIRPLFAAAPTLLQLLSTAIARVEIANGEGDPILSAWLIDAKKAVKLEDAA